jgi:hypothetical protein
MELIIFTDKYYFSSTKAISTFKAEGYTVFYFYFDTRDQGPAKVIYKGLLSSLLLNIGIQFNPTELKNLYQKYNSGAVQMPADAMKLAVLDLLKYKSSPTFIYIDAMDECQSKEYPLVTALILDLLGLGSNIHIFTTCRYSADNINMKLTTQRLDNILLAEGVVASDIQRHIQKSLDQYETSFDGIKDEVEEALIKGAHGQ